MIGTAFCGTDQTCGAGEAGMVENRDWNHPGCQADGEVENAMLIILCRDPLEPSRTDRAFEAEVAAIERLGLPYVLVDHDALVQGDEPGRVVRRVPDQSESVLAVYRGWTVTPSQYRVLHEALEARNIRMINDPDAYRHGHYLPENYPVIKGRTPRSVWLTGDLGIDRIMQALSPFGDGPAIVKDFVKSGKHEWNEACFIPSATDRRAVTRVVTRFLELQDEDLSEGLVFREFVEFEPIGVHPGSGMPLTEEYRISGSMAFRCSGLPAGPKATTTVPGHRSSNSLTWPPPCGAASSRWTWPGGEMANG